MLTCTLVNKINTRCQRANDVQVEKQELLQVVSKKYGSKSTAGKITILSTINNSFHTTMTSLSKKEEINGTQLIPCHFK